ncbi:MAG: gliding motility-associated ABC transporter substrate-binding protein GldG [Bacteroidales bacterium]|nr:gliding motility-associated ABC transporter substrate-binding protein GldG [Bacteroidales bacterium]MDD3664515.1 gliding motility-associated ABC transporter substrate-binding protein GldG [Bacteroidales bacterium]
MKPSSEKKINQSPASGKRDNRRHNLVQLGLTLLIIVLVNFIGYQLFTRFDLTSEKRYTLSPATRDLLDKVDDYVYFRVYLEGEFPAGFKRLRNETREMLAQFRAYNKKIVFEFINPSATSDQKEREKIYRQLVEQGLNPTDVKVKTNSGTETQLVFPGAIVTYRTESSSMELLQNQITTGPEQILNNSIQNLEYNIANTIRKLIARQKPKVGFVAGHGEMTEEHVYDFALALSEHYGLERVRINGRIDALTQRVTDSASGNVNIFNRYKAIIVAKPDSAFNEKDKFIIDQFVMRGGRVLWLLDGVNADMDSLKNKPTAIALAKELQLDDLLFRYGARVNYNLLQDAQCLPIMMVTGNIGNQPQFNMMPWPYFPLFNPAPVPHPISNNLNAIKAQFASSIDTVSAPGIKKTILLTTSDYTFIQPTPAIIDLSIAGKQPDPSLFNKKRVPVALLLEGKFKSLYANRMPPAIANDREIGFMEEGRETAMIVVADGDVARNQFDRKTGAPMPVGYDQDTRQTFGNRDFLLNAMDYLVDDNRLITIRSREVKIRLLDRKLIEEEKLKWQLINVATPVGLVLLAGLLITWLRKRRYGRAPGKK